MEGHDALVQMRTPVNRFPDYVRYTVQRSKTLCPAMGKIKIAQTLARAGLRLGATTVGRMLREDATPKPRTLVAGKPGDWPNSLDCLSGQVAAIRAMPRVTRGP